MARGTKPEMFIDNSKANDGAGESKGADEEGANTG